jgi:protein transport protein SEC24
VFTDSREIDWLHGFPKLVAIGLRVKQPSNNSQGCGSVQPLLQATPLKTKILVPALSRGTRQFPCRPCPPTRSPQAVRSGRRPTGPCGKSPEQHRGQFASSRAWRREKGALTAGIPARKGQLNLCFRARYNRQCDRQEGNVSNPPRLFAPSFGCFGRSFWFSRDDYYEPAHFATPTSLVTIRFDKRRTCTNSLHLSSKLTLERPQEPLLNMADYSMYHALGQGEAFDPNDPNRTTQPAPPQFSPPVAPNPFNQGAYGAPPPPGPQYQGPAPPAQSPGYGPPYQGQGQPAFSPGPLSPADDGGLAAQMGGMTLGADSGYGTARRKKKDRHAYHQVDASVGSSQPYNGIPPADTPATSFLNSAPQQGPGQYGGLSPQAGLFPASVGSQFSPMPASPAEFAARGGQFEPAAPSPTMVPAAGQGKVSPEDMPSVPLSRDSIQQYFLTNMYPTFERLVPPPATVSFAAFDQGNSSPKFARLSLTNIPASGEGLKSTNLPLGLLLQPLAPLQAGELTIPVLDFGDAGPPRCHRCRAYINPFMMFRNGGNKFVCNLCNYANDTPVEYFCATSPQGVRVDRDQRPELTRGTVEFVVPKEYWTKEPVGMRYLFLIDVTQESFNKGFLESFCEGILGAIYGADEGEEKDENGDPKRKVPAGAKVGFVTFDKEVHFYNVSPALEQAQMMIMPDVEDPFVPLSEGLFVDPYESKAVITSLLTRLPQMFSNIKNPEPALLSTLNSAIAALEKTGGKIFCSLAALPTWGPGRLFMRDDGKHPGGEPDKKLFSTEHPAWRKLAEKMVSIGVGVDFFMAAPSGGYLDIATVGELKS